MKNCVVVSVNQEDAVTDGRVRGNRVRGPATADIDFGFEQLYQRVELAELGL
jgi:hypothetical protein